MKIGVVSYTHTAAARARASSNTAPPRLPTAGPAGGCWLPSVRTGHAHQGPSARRSLEPSVLPGESCGEARPTPELGTRDPEHTPGFHARFVARRTGGRAVRWAARPCKRRGCRSRRIPTTPPRTASTRARARGSSPKRRRSTAMVLVRGQQRTPRHTPRHHCPTAAYSAPHRPHLRSPAPHTPHPPPPRPRRARAGVCIRVEAGQLPVRASEAEPGRLLRPHELWGLRGPRALRRTCPVPCAMCCRPRDGCRVLAAAQCDIVHDLYTAAELAGPDGGRVAV